MFSDNGRTKADVDHPVPGISWHPAYLHCSQVENTDIESFETYALFSILDLENVATSLMTKEEAEAREAKQVITKRKCSTIQFQRHPMFLIPSWSKAGVKQCAVNEALWVRILDWTFDHSLKVVHKLRNYG